MASGTPVNFGIPHWATRISARARPQEKTDRRALYYPCAFRGTINKFAGIKWSEDLSEILMRECYNAW